MKSCKVFDEVILYLEKIISEITSLSKANVDAARNTREGGCPLCLIIFSDYLISLFLVFLIAQSVILPNTRDSRLRGNIQYGNINTW